MLENLLPKLLRKMCFVLFIISFPGVCGTPVLHAQQPSAGSQPPTSLQYIQGAINKYARIIAYDTTTNIGTLNLPSGLPCYGLVLVIQMSGGIVDTTQSPQYGDVLDYRSTGRFEFTYLSHLDAYHVKFSPPLKNRYNYENTVQIVSVPQYSNARTVTDLVPGPSSKLHMGGIVALFADTLTLGSNIVVPSALGGAVSYYGYEASVTGYVYPAYMEKASGKGFGISWPSDSTLCGRGKFANGGGGGNSSGSGGGGGGGAGAGGKGGYQSSQYGGGDIGGIGGEALQFGTPMDPRMFRGGMGGAGNKGPNDHITSYGGQGGGIVVIGVRVLSGESHKISVHGGGADPIGYGHEEGGAGGAGGGGSIYFAVDTIVSPVILDIRGGGGNRTLGAFPRYCAGPGGGGGGGFVWHHGATLPANVSVLNSGGVAGTNDAVGNPCDKDAYGAMPGEDGRTMGGIPIPEIHPDPLPLTTVLPAQTWVCPKDAYTLPSVVTGGWKPYTYSWSTPDSMDFSHEAMPVVHPNQTTTYTLVVTDSVGCKATATTIIAVSKKPTPKITGPLWLCENSSGTYHSPAVRDHNYRWTMEGGSGSIVTGAGSPDITVLWKTPGTATLHLLQQTPEGCADSASLQVTVVASRSPRITPLGMIPLCEGDSVLLDAGSGFESYHWNNGSTDQKIVVRNSGIVIVSATDSIGCGGSDTLLIQMKTQNILTNGPVAFCEGDSVTLSLKDSFASYQWSNGSTSSGVTVKQGGTYSVRVIDSLGCRSSGSIVVTTHPLPKYPISGLASVCLPASSDYTAHIAIGNTYEWSIEGGTGTIVSGDSTAVIHVRWDRPGAGVIRLRERTPFGCFADTSIVVTVGATLAPVITANGPLTFCEGDSVELDAGGGYARYSWSNGRTDRILTVKGGGSYSVSVSESNGCSGTSQIIQTAVVAKPVPVILGPRPVCLNGSGTYFVQDSSASTISWSVTNGTLLSDSTGGSVAVLWGAAGFGIVHVRISKGMCSGDTSFTVAINPQLKPLITPSRSTTLCNGDSVLLDAGSGYVKYAWSSGALSQIISVKDSGRYVINVSDGMGCTGSDTIVVKVNAVPAPVITGPTALCEGDTITLDAGGEFVSYDWSNGDKTRTVSVSKAGLFSVMVTDSNSCIGTSALHAVAVFPKPPKPTITQRGDTLFSSAAQSYQWFKNDTAIANGTNGTYAVKRGGVYKVRTTDSNGCVVESEVLNISFSSFALSCLTPNVFNAGEVATLKLLLTSSSNLLGGPQQCRVQLRFNSSVLVPRFVYESSRLLSTERILSLSLTRPTGLTSGTLLELPFTVMLGDAECAAVHLDSVVWLNGNVVVTLENQDCDICVRVCREGGTRLFSSGGKVQLFQNQPNPFNAQTVIRYELIETGPTSLTVSDILGRRVATLVDETKNAGNYESRFDATTLPSGLYFCILKTPTAVKHRMMQVVK
jgi:hypothetical protein